MSEKISVENLLARRAELLAELEKINASLEALSSPTEPVKIGTLKNLRNSGVLAYAGVYSDKGLSRPQEVSAHEGWISNEALATLKIERGESENREWWVE